MLLELRPGRDAHQGRVRRGRPRGRPHVRRRGAGLPRGPAGPAVRRPGRQAPGAAARVHRDDARAGLHRQRPQEPAAQQPRPAAGGDRRLPAVPLAADRDHPAQGHLHAGQLRHQAADRRADRHHQGARPAAGDGDRRAPAVPVPDLPSGRGAVHAGQPGDAQRGLPAAAGAAGARRAAARRRGGRAAGRGAAGLAAARAPACAGGRPAPPRRPTLEDARADARVPRRASRRRARAQAAAVGAPRRPAPTPAPAAHPAPGRRPRRHRRRGLGAGDRPRRRPRPPPRPARPPNRSSSASSR